MKTKIDLPEFITLRQVVLWIGLGLPPQEPNLETLDNYPGGVRREAQHSGASW
jgi:hypothetical protein